MTKEKAKLFYDEFGDIAVLSCSKEVKEVVKEFEVSIFEPGRKVEPGLYEVELESWQESCDCYDPCTHEGYTMFKPVAFNKIEDGEQKVKELEMLIASASLQIRHISYWSPQRSDTADKLRAIADDLFEAVARCQRERNGYEKNWDV